MPHVWKTPAGTKVAVLGLGPRSNRSILDFFRQDISTTVWQRAASHHAGQGLELGVPSFRAVKEASGVLLRKKLFAASAALQAVAIGGATPLSRIASQEEATCPHCLRAIEDDDHRYWWCSEIDTIPDPHRFIARSNHLRDKMQADPTNWVPCLRNRGIIPGPLTPTQLTPQPDEFVVQINHFGATTQAAQGKAGSDGAGGPRWVPPEIRRVGAGSATVDLRLEDGAPQILSAALICSSVPGNQTVPRAETQGALQAVKGGPVSELVIDATYTLNGLQAKGTTRQQLYTDGRNGDLWEPLYAEVPEGLVGTQIKSHPKPPHPSTRQTLAIGLSTSPPISRRESLRSCFFQIHAASRRTSTGTGRPRRWRCDSPPSKNGTGAIGQLTSLKSQCFSPLNPGTQTQSPGPSIGD